MMRTLSLTMAAAILATGSGTLTPAIAETAAVADGACGGLVGTFLTRKMIGEEDAIEEEGRSLISFTNGGHVFFNDSAQGGGEGYQPFTTARGAWSCEAADGGATFAFAVIDFTLATADNPDEGLARVDVTGRYDAADGTISGSAIVSFYPLTADPIAKTGALPGSATYNFSGEKIPAP
ncbi:MAG: hypothetical protein AAGD34_09145 [Pseudomonadota bacterium]